MESLAYIHLALAYEESASASSTPVLQNLKLFEGLNQQKLSSRAWIYLLSLAVSLSMLGIANEAQADLQTGSRGSQVTALQQRLRQLGYFKGRITGNFDSATRQAVVRYQKAKKLGADGIVGSETETALSKRTTRNVRVRPSVRVSRNQAAKNVRVRQSASSTVRPSRNQAAGNVRLREIPSSTRTLSSRSVSNQAKTNVSVRNNTTFLGLGSSGSTVSVLQQRLKQAGFYKGAINGFFSLETEAALRRFQQAKRLTVDGVAGARTQTALLSVGKRTPSQPLSPGSNRQGVQALQRRLQRSGFYQGPIDGVLSSQTKQAIAAAQQAYGIRN